MKNTLHKLWNIQNLAKTTDGEMVNIEDAEQCFNAVSTDSRTVNSGSLYVAIAGDNFDGHDFIESAYQNGAILALVSTVSDCAISQIKVADTRLALASFASWYRQNSKLKKLLAVTGSNGKTTCKNLISFMLSNYYKPEKVMATPGNFNNDLGVPRTLLGLKQQHEFAVVEMGANHLHEIDYLSRIAQPDVALITIAAEAHLEGFGSLAGIIITKGEIMNGLAKGSPIVLNADSPGFDTWLKMAAERELKVLSFGKSKQADFSLFNFEQAKEHLAFEFSYQDKTFPVKLSMLGEHNAMNALASLVSCFAAGCKLEKLIPPLANFDLEQDGDKGRLQQSKLPNGQLIDDSYNANPSSVKAGIDVLVSIAQHPLLCIGAMAEIGEKSLQEHANIARYAKQKGVKFLLSYGNDAKEMPNHFGKQAFWFASHKELADKAISLIKDDLVDSCLVKGSRSAQMEKVVAEIKLKLRKS